jgi:hypothetical protein
LDQGYQVRVKDRFGSGAQTPVTPMTEATKSPQRPSFRSQDNMLRSLPIIYLVFGLCQLQHASAQLHFDNATAVRKVIGLFDQVRRTPLVPLVYRSD